MILLAVLLSILAAGQDRLTGFVWSGGMPLSSLFDVETKQDGEGSR
jgi:hypothetical protein